MAQIQINVKASNGLEERIAKEAIQAIVKEFTILELQAISKKLEIPFYKSLIKSNI